MKFSPMVSDAVRRATAATHDCRQAADSDRSSKRVIDWDLMLPRQMTAGRRSCACILLLLLVVSVSPARVLERRAKDTLTAVELNRGDTLLFTLANGDVRSLTLEDTQADVLMTNVKEYKKVQPDGALLYHFTARVVVDGQPMLLERYVGSQESFYEPYVINGMRLWFDAVQDIFEFLEENHGICRPAKHARFAVQDASRRILPVPLYPWYPNDRLFIDVADTYNGDDVWMGAYGGVSAHGGLDINMPKNTPAWAPIDFDDHYLFNSLYRGDENNRWRGVRKWLNGDTWILQDHHIYNLLVPEHARLKAGTYFAANAGTFVGEHNHAHFIFNVRQPHDDDEILLDPWILFWQTFEDIKERTGMIRAGIGSVSKRNSGEPITFRGDGSRKSYEGAGLSFYWSFGDGCSAIGANPTHTYVRPGVYPVTLTVDDGAHVAAYTQHVTVNGPPLTRPALALAAPDEETFRPRPVQAAQVYGQSISYIPYSMQFLARPSRSVPDEKTIELQNAGGGTLPDASDSVRYVRYADSREWLTITPGRQGRGQCLRVQVDAKGLQAGVHTAVLTIRCAGAINGLQQVLILLTVPAYPPMHVENDESVEKVVDDSDAESFATPWFWVRPKFKKWPQRGFKGSYLTNGARSAAGEYVRFRPDLAAGRYRVMFHPATPFPDDSRFQVRIKHKNGDERVWVQPARERMIGEFEFEEGTDGFVDILADGSVGQVLADALIFRRVLPGNR